MADDGMFAPLPGAGRRRQAAADPWRPIVPVPDGAPPGPPRHPRGKPSGSWPYSDTAGKLLGYVLRFDLPGGGKEFAPATFCENTATGAREWRFKAWLVPRPLYGLDRLAKRPAAPVVVCEGEKAADAAHKLLPNHVVVASPNGAKSAGKADWQALAGRTVTIWPDNDDEGRTYAAAIAKALRGIAASVRIAAAPAGTPEKWDAADALSEGWNQTAAAALIAAAISADGAATTAGAASLGSGRGRPRQSDQLLDFLPEMELWHSPNREAFATIKVRGYFENWPVRSRDFREWLSGRCFTATGAAPASQATEDALRVIEGRAKHDGPEHPVFLRIGEHGGAVFIDLADAQWRVVRVTRGGWRVIDQPPIKFTRSPAMRPLPVPEPGGMIEELRSLVNVRDEADFKLIVAVIVGYFNPRGPYAILIIRGEPGAAKSSACRLVRALTDPNEAPLRLLPRDAENLIAAARNSRVLAFDNASSMPDWLSDALCSIATGAGYSARELYSNTGEVVFGGARPVMLNGIPDDLGSRTDLAHRAVVVTLQEMPHTERRTEQDYWRDVEAHLPRIFGALLDAVASALRHGDEIPPVLPRMADFAAWVSAAEAGLGWEKGEFIAAYLGNRKGAIEAAIEADPIGEAACRLVATRDWSGSPTELLTRLAELVPDTVSKSRTWPAANKLRGRLRRLAPALRERGIMLDLDGRANDSARTRIIGIRRDRAAEPA